MGYYAAKKAGQCVRKLQYMTAIEIYVALQAMDFLKPLEPSPSLAKVRDFVRKKVPLWTMTGSSIRILSIFSVWYRMALCGSSGAGDWRAGVLSRIFE